MENRLNKAAGGICSCNIVFFYMEGEGGERQDCKEEPPPSFK